MTLPIERFKDAYVNHRWNPFTDTDMAVDAEEDELLIPSGSPFLIQLLEVPRYNDPTSVAVRCYGVDTSVDETSASGQPILKVGDTNGFSPGDTIIINRSGAREEERIIDTIQAGISLTVTVNLEFEHTATQADVVEKYIAFTEVGTAPAQSQFRVDYPPDDGEGTGLIEFNQNDAEKEVRVNYKATGSSALAETLDTKVSYAAGNPTDNQVLGFVSGASVYRSFDQIHKFGDYMDQAVKQVSNPTFNILTLTDNLRLANNKHIQFKDSGGTYRYAVSLSGTNVYEFGQSGFAMRIFFDNYYLDSLIAHNKVPDSDKLDGQHGAYYSPVGHTHAHGAITGVSANQHHAQVHTLGSHSDFSTYLDQAVKTTSTPSFQHLNLTNAASKLQGGTKLALEAGATGICSATIYGDETASGANMYIAAGSPYRILKSTSSRRIKDKITDLELDSSLIHNLRPVSFSSKCKGDDEDKRFIGLIADEVEKVYPEIIIYNEKHEAESYDNQMLLTLAIAELQKLKKQITN